VTLDKRGKCGGRKSHKELDPTLVKKAKLLYRRHPTTKKRRPLLNISEELFNLGFKTKKGKPFSASQIKRLVDA